MSKGAPLHLRVEGEDGVRDLTLGEGEQVTIGRDGECDVVLAGRQVSRRHAILRIEGGAAVLHDLSQNGVQVGSRMVTRETVNLGPNGGFRIGNWSLSVRPGGAPPKPAPAVLGGGTPHPERVPEDVPVELRRRIHRMLLDHLDLHVLERRRIDQSLRPRVEEALRQILRELAGHVPPSVDVGRFVAEMADEALGLGPLESLLADPTVTEVMVVDPRTVYVERKGRLELTGCRFTDDESVRAVLERIVAPLGRRVDESNPIVDARLPDGSRVNAIIPPLALRGPCITIRKFATTRLTMDDVVHCGTLDTSMARFLGRVVKARKNVVLSGGTGSGKTTLLNILAGAIPSDERIVTVEDAAELKLRQPHVVSLESRPANLEGSGVVTIRDLVKNALRMRPDRIVVGEVRGGEALDMLQAMNTGHEGSLTTVHANSPRDAVARIETLALMAGLDLPARAIREQIATSLHVLVQLNRLSDGTRRITSIAEVIGLDDDGRIDVREIFTFDRAGVGPNGQVLGEHRTTGYLPSFLDELIRRGLIDDGVYL